MSLTLIISKNTNLPIENYYLNSVMIMSCISYNKKVLNLSHKYLSKNKELNTSASTQLTNIYWTDIKETLYNYV
jgi:hypothetical protein